MQKQLMHLMPNLFKHSIKENNVTCKFSRMRWDTPTKKTTKTSNVITKSPSFDVDSNFRERRASVNNSIGNRFIFDVLGTIRWNVKILPLKWANFCWTYCSSIRENFSIILCAVLVKTMTKFFWEACMWTGKMCI